METSQQHIGDTRTSAFTLPTPTRKQLRQRERMQRKEQQKEQQQQQQQQQQQHDGEHTVGTTTSSTPASPLHCADSIEGFSSSPEGRSPSIPWLMEYLSSSFSRAPAMVFDHMLCSCASTSMQFQEGDSSNGSANHNSIIVSENSYFDDTIVKSDPANVVRSPTKISSTRWEALRAVVASHEDYTTQDYCDFYERTVPCQGDGKQQQLPPQAADTGPHQYDEIFSAESLYYPIKTKPTDWSKFRESSILAPDDSMEGDDNDSLVADDDDDIRMEPPASPTPGLCGENDDPDASLRDLNTCHSFDQYIDTTRYFCAQDEQQQQPPRIPATPPPATPPRVPPAHRLPDRRRSRQIGAATTLVPRTLGFQRLQRSLHPPSPSTDTHTTISLSQSFAREFDDDDDSSEHMVERRSPVRSSAAPMTPPSVVRQPQQQHLGGLFLDLDQIASNTTNNGPANARLGSPFRRLRPRTRVSVDEDEMKEDESDVDVSHYPSTPPRKPKKSSTDEEDEEDDEFAYRCLVRMSPDNYRHEQKHHSYDDDWMFPEEAASRMVSVTTTVVSSSASSSVLLPLHPHQRIIAPLPHDLDSYDDMDHSGYTFFRNALEKRQRSATSPVECS